MVAVVVAEVDGAVAVAAAVAEEEDVTTGDMAVVAVEAMVAVGVVTAVGEEATEDVIGGKWTRTVIVIPLFYRTGPGLDPSYRSTLIISLDLFRRHRLDDA